ncbi:MAG: VOC family protein [Dehalococcoidia bacterium]|nr:VOC family protein [Dehalococcoidia bacterium]
MKIEKIDHIAIRVRDLAKARKFFTDAFGSNFRSLGNSPELDIKSIMDVNGIELVEPLLPDGPNSRLLAKYGEGLTLLSLKVTDLDEAVKDIEKLGVRITAKVQTGDMRMAILHPKDTFGVQIELIEYNGEHPAISAIKGYKPDI